MPTCRRNLVLIGFASSGKTATGQALAAALGFTCHDSDREVEAAYRRQTGGARTCRGICAELDPEAFATLEYGALAMLCGQRRLVLATGGGTPLWEPSRALLRDLGRVVYLCPPPAVIFRRMQAKGVPLFLQADPTLAGLEAVWARRDPIYRALADRCLDNGQLSVAQTVRAILAPRGTSRRDTALGPNAH